MARNSNFPLKRVIRLSMGVIFGLLNSKFRRRPLFWQRNHRQAEDHTYAVFHIHTPGGGGGRGWPSPPDREVRGSAADPLNTLLGGEVLTP